MDQQQQTQQTEKIIVQMLDFLDSSSEEENDLDKMTSEKCSIDIDKIEKDINDNLLPIKVNSKSKKDLKKVKKPTTAIAKELKKLKQEFPIWKTKEIATNNKNSLNLSDARETLDDSLSCKKSLNIIEKSHDPSEVDMPTSDYANTDWYNKLETNCRLSSSNSYTQEINRAIYQDTTGHPANGSAEYYQAAQNYAIYGKHFLDFPENLQVLMNEKNSQNIAAENSNSMSNFGQWFYSKPQTATPNVIAPPTSTAAYYQIYNSMQTQARPTLANNPGNCSTAYGIFLGNKVTYVHATPTNPSLIYNQHSTTTTNFVSNSLANAALATSPTILYTNPMLTTTTQQYLNTFFKESQFLSTALTANSTQTSAVAPNATGIGLYERLLYAQMLQQQLYQTQQAAAVAAMFQHKQRAAAAAATLATVGRQSASGNVATTSNRLSPQLLATPPSTTTGSNGSCLNTCTRQARNNSPAELLQLKQQTTTTAKAATGNAESAKCGSD